MFNYSLNLETMMHDSRSSFKAFWIVKLLIDRIKGVCFILSFQKVTYITVLTSISTNINWSFGTLFRDNVIYLLWFFFFFWYKCQEHLVGVHPRNLHVSNLPRSMASKKSKIPMIATERVGGLISNNSSTAPNWLLKITLLF